MLCVKLNNTSHTLMELCGLDTKHFVNTLLFSHSHLFVKITPKNKIKHKFDKPFFPLQS